MLNLARVAHKPSTHPLLGRQTVPLILLSLRSLSVLYLELGQELIRGARGHFVLSCFSQAQNLIDIHFLTGRQEQCKTRVRWKGMGGFTAIFGGGGGTMAKYASHGYEQNRGGLGDQLVICRYLKGVMTEVRD